MLLLVFLFWQLTESRLLPGDKLPGITIRMDSDKLSRPAAEYFFEPSNVNTPLDVDVTKISAYVKYLPHQFHIPRPVSIYNAFRDSLEIFWDDGSAQGIYNGHIGAGKFMNLNTYVTHSFFCFKTSDPTKRVARFTIAPEEYMLIVGPDPSDRAALKSASYKQALEAKAFRDA
jgi:hypothetical protein